MRKIYIISYIILFFYSNLQSEEKWLTKKVLFYEVNYTNADSRNIKSIINFIVQFDKKMKSVLNTEKYSISFEKSRFEIYLYPKDSNEIAIDITQSKGGTSRKNNKEIYNGTLKIQGLNAYSDKNHFYRLFAASISGIYFHLLCSVNNIKFYDMEKWFVQGLKQYSSIYHSTNYWENEGYKIFLKRLVNDYNGIGTKFKLTIKNDYRDGFLMICMLNDVYGIDKIIDLLLYKNESFEKKVENVLNINFKQFLKKVDEWKKDTIKIVEKY